ncbi:MAG: hypothetical protein NTX11_02450 [Candidatus Saccharibacteria bacterium]|nr:hypothetical protein [Candidatus Saccharibacteria bacterium]
MPNRKQSKTEKIRSNRQITRPLIITVVCIVVGIAALVIAFAATGNIPGVSLDIGSSSTVTSPAQTVSRADALEPVNSTWSEKTLSTQTEKYFTGLVLIS